MKEAENRDGFDHGFWRGSPDISISACLTIGLNLSLVHRPSDEWKLRPLRRNELAANLPIGKIDAHCTYAESEPTRYAHLTSVSAWLQETKDITTDCLAIY